MVLLAAALATPLYAADVGQAAIDSCIDRIRTVGGPDGQSGQILSTEYSEANSLIMFEDAGGTVWRCLVANSGEVADLSMAQPSDDGNGAMAGAPAGGTTSTEQVHFAKGKSSAEMNDGLTPGSSTRFVLGARDGQFLNVSIAAYGPGLTYQIFNPDGSFLLDQIDAAQPYRGQLWQKGDHVVEVLNRGGDNTSYTVTFAIE